MYDRFKSDSLHLIGTALGGESDSLLLFMKDFERNHKTKSRLVHVVDDWNVPPTAVYPGEYLFPKVAIALQLEARDAALKRLEEIGKTFESDSVNAVVAGNAAQALISDAATSGAKLIVCGTKAISHRFLPKGFSTALSLMADSPIPVMIVPEDCRSFKDEEPVIMLADDLTDSCWGALHTALELCLSLKKPKLVHVHMFDSRREELKQFSKKLMEKLDLDTVPLDGDFSFQKLADEFEERVKEKMNHRLGTAKGLIESAGGTYEVRTYFGDVQKNFTRATLDYKPDLVVFGRHETVHRRPFSIGKMPFYAMLDLHKPLIIAPRGQ